MRCQCFRRMGPSVKRHQDLDLLLYMAFFAKFTEFQLYLMENPTAKIPGFGLVLSNT